MPAPNKFWKRTLVLAAGRAATDWQPPITAAPLNTEQTVVWLSSNHSDWLADVRKVWFYPLYLMFSSCSGATSSGWTPTVKPVCSAMLRWTQWALLCKKRRIKKTARHRPRLSSMMSCAWLQAWVLTAVLAQDPPSTTWLSSYKSPL